MYDPALALVAIDENPAPILGCLVVTAVFAFLYFFAAIRIAIRQQVYVVPFVASALFFWHDLTFVLMYEHWFHHYNHWWVKLWWFALCGTVPLEAFMIWQVIRYGHQELWPRLSPAAFRTAVIAATLGIGALWWVIKVALNDDLFFLTFAITAVFAVPFHTAIMSRRQSRAGQSIFMEASVIVMIVSMSAAFMQAAPAFRAPPYLAFLAVFILWPLFNIWLINRYPRLPGN